MTDFEVSENANRFLLEIVGRRRTDCQIRLELSPGGCSWPSFGLSLGEKAANDVEFRTGDLLFLIDNDLLQRTKPIRIYYMPETPGAKFSIVSNLHSTATCWGCSTDCKNAFGDQNI